MNKFTISVKYVNIYYNLIIYMEIETTIVMSVRENYSQTIISIESLIKNTTIPYNFIFIDYKVPDFIKTEISKFDNINVIASESPYPSISMHNIIPMLNTKYTVFLDNNIVFTPLWLENLIECMKTDNAGIVGPVYLWNKDKIHMYGGNIMVRNNNFMEEHYLVNHHKNIINSLHPRKCDFVEFHCLMVKTDLLKKNILDPSLLIIHEHIDLSLAAKKLGYDTYVTPYSVVEYVNNVTINDYEISFFKERWNNAVAEKDIEYFCKKWGFNNNHYFNNIRTFVKTHLNKYLHI
jgi:GT2 family glycosyltransferase